VQLCPFLFAWRLQHSGIQLKIPMTEIKAE
jgi:hypothetical protein